MRTQKFWHEEIYKQFKGLVPLSFLESDLENLIQKEPLVNTVNLYTRTTVYL